MPRHDLAVDRRALRRVLRTTEDLLRRSGLGGSVGGGIDAGRVGRVLALAFPDRLLLFLYRFARAAGQGGALGWRSQLSGP
jgi:hypothetical protein